MGYIGNLIIGHLMENMGRHAIYFISAIHCVG